MSDQTELVLRDDNGDQLVATAMGDGVVLVHRVMTEAGTWHVYDMDSITWPEIRRLAAMDPESPMTRVRAMWERITAHPEWHSDANGETMLVVSDDAMAEMDAALDPGTEGGDE